jgi:membrane protein implicated in regulation of membrane protease activity
MRLKTVQIIAGLAAAIAFVLAFIAAGILLVSGLFMALGLVLTAWLAWSLIRQVQTRSRKQANPTRP